MTVVPWAIIRGGWRRDMAASDDDDDDAPVIEAKRMSRMRQVLQKAIATSVDSFGVRARVPRLVNVPCDPRALLDTTPRRPPRRTTARTRRIQDDEMRECYASLLRECPELDGLLVEWREKVRVRTRNVDRRSSAALVASNHSRVITITIPVCPNSRRCARPMRVLAARSTPRPERRSWRT